MIRAFTLTCLFLAAHCAGYYIRAQENELLFENYNSEKGLSQNSGYAITQDREGFIWVGTQDGLNRFEGLGFKVYRNDTNNVYSIPFNDISSLLCDSKGRVWIGSPTVLCIYLAAEDKFYKPADLLATFPSQAQVLSINKMMEDRRGRIWILTRYHGLLCFDAAGNSFTQQLNEKHTRDKLTGLAEDHEGNIWVSSTEQLYRHAGDSFIVSIGKNKLQDGITISELAAVQKELWVGTMNHGIFILSPTSKQPLPAKHLAAGKTARHLSSNEIKCVLKDNHNNVWIGTRNAGLCRYDPHTGNIQRSWQSTLVDHSLPKNFILSLYQDRQGIIWAGLSGGGLAKYDPDKFQFQTYRQQSFSSNTLPDNMIFCLYGKSDREIMVGTQNGGMAILNTETKTFRSFTRQTNNARSIVNNTVYGITKGNDNDFWVATWGGLCRFRPAMPPQESFTRYPAPGKENLYSVTKLKKQNALLCSGQNGIFLFDLDSMLWKPVKDKTGFTDSNSVVVRYFYEQDEHAVWLATEGLGLLVYDYVNGLFRQIPEVYSLTKNVRHLLPARDAIWLATDNGLVRYDQRSEKITGSWTTSNGLPNDVVYGILKDSTGHLWLSTNNGLSMFDIRRNSFKNYDISYGLQGMEFNTAACFKDSNGKLYFGGINGLNVFDPSGLSANAYPPVVHITGVKIFDEQLKTEKGINFTPKIELDHRRNFITFEFSALNYSHTDKNTYSFMLEGVDEQWIDAGTRNFAAYTQLLPGRYTFKVRAANSDGKWSPGYKQLELHILPPFWKTWWFLSLLFAIAIGLVILLFRYKANQIRKEERLKAEFNKKITDAEKAALRAQMNPHFIFNTLNSINSYIIGNNPRVASDYLTKFARLIRIILDNSKNEWIPLSKEIETLRLYLLMESVRFNNKFDYEISVDETLDQENIKVPPMIIQPYVENAIWHGLLHKKEKGKVTVSIDRNSDNKLQVNISDNGIGRHQAALLKSKESNRDKSYGMKITSERLLKSNELNTIQTIDHVDRDRNAAGTTVILSINI